MGVEQIIQENRLFHCLGNTYGSLTGDQKVHNYWTVLIP